MCLDLLAIQSSSSLYHRQCPGDEAKIFSVLAKHTPYSIVIFSCLGCRRFILIFLTNVKKISIKRRPTNKSYFVACQFIPFAFSNIPVNTGTSTVKPFRTGGHRKAESDSML